MNDPFARTRYRVAQHWRFESTTPEVKDTFIIVGVEDFPAQGIVCLIQVECDPPFYSSPNSILNIPDLWMTQAALDASVVELVLEKGPLPSGCTSHGEFIRSTESWGPNPTPFAQTRIVGEAVRDAYAKLVRYRNEAALRSPYVPPPDEALGLWSLISYDKAERFRELLESNPSLANAPLASDPSDDYSRFGEGGDWYPLMMAAASESVNVAKLLISFGANVRQRNNRGETPLHFSAKARNGGCGADEIARILCERGADPNVLNNDGQPPLTCDHCMTEVAEVLAEFGAKLNLNHAIRIGKLDWVRHELRDNPRAVSEAAYPDQVICDLVFYLRLHPDVRDLGDYAELATWYRRAELDRQLFEEHCDIFEAIVQRGADPNADWALFYAVQSYDTSLAAWLLERGADQNHRLKSKSGRYLTDIACTRRMVNLLKHYGAVENPYSNELDEWGLLKKRLKDRFI